MNKNDNNLQNIRHSCAHLLAAAVKELWPGTHNAIGPSIENGFYQDFDFGDRKISEEDLPKIEEKMHELLKEWHEFNHREVSVEEARKIFKDNPYKLELIDELSKKDAKITINDPGKFIDLCKGGHAENPQKEMQHFKLMSLAGAYWRRDEKNKMLTRIYGTAFPTKKELDNYLFMLEESKKRDHKKLGRELELFIFDDTSPGMAYWLPKGLTLYNTLYEFARKMYRKYGYQEIATPLLNKKELYETSGHWSHYKDVMFVSDMGEHEVFGIKPMNCPNAMKIFGYKTRSYAELPLRLAETSMLHRYELSGVLNGLFRIRAFRQDDAHIFVKGDQIKSEFESLMQMVEEMYVPFDLSYRLRFGTRPEKFLGEASDWDLAEKELKHVLDDSGKEYVTAEGEGAFYGPKVDILMKDCLNREWQTGTIQLDLQQPKRFELVFADSDGSLKMPFVFHRAILGSFERFIGILIEHFAGAFPVWLAPVQVMLLPIADRHNEYAKEVHEQLVAAGIRSELNDRSGTLQAKIREATLQKVPFMGIIGDREIQRSKIKDQKYEEMYISVRTREGKDEGSLELSHFLQKVKEDIDKKT